IGQAVFPGLPDRGLVAVRHERLRENLSHAHVILDQEELHPSPSRLSGTPPSSQGPREFFNVTRGCEDGILRASSSKGRAFPASRRILTSGIPRGGGARRQDPATCRGSADRKSTRLNSSHSQNSDARLCLEKKNNAHT